MRKNLPNFLFFLVIAVGFYFLWSYAERKWLPQPQKNAKKDEADDEAKQKAREEQDRLDARVRDAVWEESRAAATAAVAGTAVFGAEATRPDFGVAAMTRQLRWARTRALASVAGAPAVAVEPARPSKPPEPPKASAPPRQPTLVALGDDSFYNKVLLSTEGGGVQQVVLPKFEAADRLGHGVRGEPLYLVPGVQRTRPKYLAERFPRPDLQPGKQAPDADLDAPSYTLFHYPTPDDKFPDPKLGETEWKVVSEERPAGGEHRVVFETELGDPYFVKLRKTYTLGPKDYHVGLRVEVERLPGGQKGKGQLRYQLSGPRGLPIEGEWYSTTYRLALIGWLDRKGGAERQYETAADVAIKRGGDLVTRSDTTFKYMAVATQYFTSAVAVDDTAEGGAKNPWSYVRATTEIPFDKKADFNQPFFEDLTVRAASDVLDLAPGEKVVHSYLIYNGPSKVRLLGLMEGDRAVDGGLVDRYQDRLGLKTITDYQSPTWLGSIASGIGWTRLVIAFTNLMHWFLSALHALIPSWALCIIVLTVIVRLILMYPSKKQTAMNVRMMEVTKKLAPQFEELKKKYADDFHGYNRAKMQLMLAHGVNPIAQMGGCLLLLFQLPVMMGLYFCLQESIFFRLEPFLWVDNLAAPDMTLWWGEHIPYVSDPANIGGMLYLGPYLNILPIAAIVLMFWQQLKMLPPATDDQSRQQRMMMKVMMFLMPLFFYKFAAGLALYFIIGTLWGLAERRMVKKAADLKAAEDGDLGSGGGGDGPKPDTEPPKPKGLFGRLKEAMRKRMEEMQRQADEQARRQIRNKNAPDQGQSGQGGGAGGGGPNPPRRDDRRDKKKRRRK